MKNVSQFNSFKTRLSVLLLSLAILPAATVALLAHNFLAAHVDQAGALAALDMEMAGAVAVILLPASLAILYVARRLALWEATRLVSEDKFRLLFDLAKDSITVLDLQGRIVDINRAGHERLGYTREEMIGREISRFNTPEFAVRVAQRVAAVHGGGHTVVEAAHVRRDGTVLPVEVNSSMVELDGERRILSIVRDISERKLMDGTLRLIRFALDKVSMTVAMMRVQDGRFIYVNDRACRDFGYSREELLGMTMFDVDPEFSPSRWAELNRELRRAPLAPFETVHRTRDGREYPVEVTANVLEIDGEVYHVGFAHDITQRKMAKEILQKSEATLRAALDNLPYRTWIKDTDSRYVIVNKVYAEHLKLANPADAAGKTDRDLHPQEVAEQYRADDALIMRTGQPRHVEIQVVEGTYVRWLDTFKSPIIDQDGKLLGTVGFARDITDRKTEEEQFKLVLGTSLDGFWATDLQARFLEVNDAYCELIGYSREELLTMAIRDVEAIESPEDTARRAKKIIATGHDRFETRHRAKDGRIVEVEVSVTYTPMRGGRLYCFLRDITARKNAERRLQERHAHLEQEIARRTAELTRAHTALEASFAEIDDLYQNAPCGYHSIDANGMVVRMNDTELSWLGYAREEVVGKRRMAELLTPHRRAQFHAEFPLVKERGSLHGIETEFVRKDGSVMSALVNVSTVRDGNGEFLMSRATVYDITRRKKADEVLRFHSQILGNLSEGVVLVRASDGVIVFTNSRFDDMFGWEPGALIGRDVSIVNAPGEQSPEQTAQAIIGDLAEKGAWSGEVRNVRKDGTAFWCHVRITGFDHPEYGKVWVAVHEDIDERTRAEQSRLRQSRALRLLSEGNAALIHALDEQSLLESICRLVVQTGGYAMAWVGRAEQDAEKTISIVAQYGDTTGYLAGVQISWADNDVGQGPTAKAIRLGTTNINQNWAHSVSLRPWFGAAQKRGFRSSIAFPIACEGRIFGALNLYATDADLFSPEEVQLLEKLASNLAFGLEALRVRAREVNATQELKVHRNHLELLVRQRTAELSAAKSQAEQANNAKSRFLAAASHDLRQPLTALKLYVGVLRSQLNPGQSEVLAKMEECVGGLGNLLSKLLDLSKLDAGVVKPHISSFALDGLLNEVVAAHAPDADAKGLRLRYAHAALTVRTDPVLLQRIIGNFVANAIRYTKRGGVLIGCRSRGGKMWVEVWDTGIGIPSDRTGEIFEEFRQLGDDARTYGSGLGLTIVARTASLLGLQIRVQSRLNRGSMFAVELPLGQRMRRPAGTGPAPLAERMRVAVVDDNPVVLNALACGLESAGHDVVAAESSKDLLDRLGPLPQIVVCDYRLAGGETGFDVVSAVRAAFGNKLPAVIITGDTDPKLMRSMSKRGLVILHKPVDIDDLQQGIVEALNRGATV